MAAEGYFWGKCARNGNLGNCSFSVQSDGAYVTYTPEGGADAVTKKLGDTDLENIQTITAYGTFTITENVTCYGQIVFPKIDGRKYIGLKSFGWTYAWEAPTGTYYAGVGLNENIVSVDFHSKSSVSNIRCTAIAYYIEA